jgi:mono/diheme cytochrome c family protein
MSAEPHPHPSSPAGAPAADPRGATVPMWLIIFTFLLCYWGAVYFDQAGGWFDAKVYTPYHSSEELALYSPAPAGPGEFGRTVYNRPTCAACHQADGKGTAGTFPPLSGSDWVNEKDPGRIIRAVLNGLGGPISVNGHSFNNNMVPWGPTLNDEEIAAVITYVRQNKDWGNNASEVTPAQVKAVRDKIKDHPSPFTPDELMKISPSE